MDQIMNHTHKYKTLTIESVDRTERWLKTLGINFSNSRFGESRRILSQITQGKTKPNLDTLWSLTELADLIQLCESFSSSKEIEDAFIKKITGGANFLCDEKKSTARDLFFETKTASRLKRSGCEIIRDNSHDVVFKKENIIFGVECKRPSNNKKLISLIDYAYNRQLNKLPNKRQQGIIFIDLGRILYKKFSEVIKSDCELPWSTPEVLEQFRNETDIKYKKLIQNKVPEIAHGVLMMVFHYSFPVIFQQKHGVIISMLSHYCLMSSSTNPYLESISSGLRDSVGEWLPK